jgi:hypothetical protein
MKSNIQNPLSKKYLFFISQDYSFPVLRPLQDAIKQRGDRVKWFMYGKEIHKEYLFNSEEVLENIHEIIDYHPDAVFVPGNVVPSFISGLKVQVFHGLPGQKVKKNGQIYHYIIRGMFDLYCTQGPESTQKFQVLAKKYGYFKVRETGWSKLDPLFQVSKEEKPRQKSIFFASTFSPRYSKAKILYPFVVKMLEKYDFQWYVTLHPKMDKAIVKAYQSLSHRNIKFILANDIMQYFKNSDLMICDTSSITYEFATQLKPVITFQSAQGDTAFINVQTVDALENKLLEYLGQNKENNHQKHSIEKYVSQYHPYRDGKSSQRVLDAVEALLDKKHHRKKPLNFIRNFKLRKALNYWKF